jgi:MoxR-like ATPase
MKYEFPEELDQKQKPSPAEIKRGYRPYLPPPGLVKAVNLAIALQRPLLLEGEPGCGKTQLAHALARQLAVNNKLSDWPLCIWNVKSSSRAKDGLYTFDAVDRLRDAQMASLNTEKDNKDKEQENEDNDSKDNDNKNKDKDTSKRVADPKNYRVLGPLGEAINITSTTNHRAIVLIDEVDKGNYDFGNDLLNELENFSFYIPETEETIPEFDERFEKKSPPPIVILTSNRNKPLPDAFLRRCLYFSIPFPDKEFLTNIAKIRLKEEQTQEVTGEQEQLINDAIDCFNAVRDAMTSPTSRQPSTSEFIDFLRAVLSITSAKERQEVIQNPDGHFLGTMLKTKEDQELYHKKKGKS